MSGNDSNKDEGGKQSANARETPKEKTYERPWTDPAKFAKWIRSNPPKLVEVGKPKPKCVLSFGGAGWLMAYSLGVAYYLSQEEKELVAQSYILGAGTGMIPATALACQVDCYEKMRDFFLTEENLFIIHSGDKKREEMIRAGCKEFLPENAKNLMNGKVSLVVGMNNRDQGFLSQKQDELLYGHHIALFESNEDITDCIVAGTTCDINKMRTFRDAKKCVQRGTCMSMASQCDQYLRHIYIHGLCGFPYSRKHMRHQTYFGRHGMVVNTDFSYPRQFWMACWPCAFGGRKSNYDNLMKSFDNGYHAARRYERWEEDPYHFAKADRSVGGDEDWKSIRGFMFGGGWRRKGPEKDRGLGREKREPNSKRA